LSGDFTFLGVTHTLTFDAILVGKGTDRFNGKEVIGLSASGSFDRSDFGLNNLEPFVGDKVILEINT
jgi:polyisoprenoid-binding protein YceI